MALTTVNPALLDTQAQYTGFKNRIINGAMVIDQRNAGASLTATTANLYSLDRFQAVASQSSKYTVQQNAASVTPPTGFINYLGVTSSSAYSVLTGDYFSIQQTVEGLNITDFAWGTASAATVTLSFWVRSSLTGTFGGVVKNNGGTRSYPFSYTINAANTWEFKTITIPGDTTGTWLTTNGAGILLNFGLGAGSTYSGTAGAWAAANIVQPTGTVSVVGTNGATFYITGVQLEKGSTATSFDYRPYGTELALCQRYYETQTSLIRPYVANTNDFHWLEFKTDKRASPTVTWTTGASGLLTAISGPFNAYTSGFELAINCTNTGAAGGFARGIFTASSEL